MQHAFERPEISTRYQVGNSKGNMHPERPRRKWEYNIKIDYDKILSYEVDLLGSAQVTVVEYCVFVYFLSMSETISFSRTTPFHEVHCYNIQQSL